MHSRGWLYAALNSHIVRTRALSSIYYTSILQAYKGYGKVAMKLETVGV